MTPSSGVIEETERGAWIADVVFPEESDSKIDIGSGAFTGTILSQRTEGGRVLCRIGKDLTGTVADKQYYGSVPVARVLEDIYSGATTTLTDRPVNYNRMKGTIGQALDALADSIGASWRVGRDGVLVLYRPTDGAAVDSAKVVRTGSTSSGHVILECDSAADVQVGMTYEGKRIRRVRFGITASRFEAEIAFDLPDVDTRYTIDYTKTYAAKVDSQNSDGSVNVIVDGRFAVSNVTMLSGIPGSKITMNPGDLVTFGFFGSRPGSPYALCTAQGDGSKAVARVDDTADAGTLLIASTSTPAAPGSPVSIASAYVPPGPTHDAEVATQTAALAAFAPRPYRLSAIITSGQERVKL